MFTTNNSEIKSLMQEVDLYIAELRKLNPTKDSHELYLLNNLVQFNQSLRLAQSEQDVKNAASILSRFCVESFNWDTNEFKKYIALSEKGFNVAKTFNDKFQNHETF